MTMLCLTLSSSDSSEFNIYFCHHSFYVAFFLSMTIPNLTVNLSGVFEYGQAYVGKEVDVQFDDILLIEKTVSYRIMFQH